MSIATIAVATHVIAPPSATRPSSSPRTAHPYARSPRPPRQDHRGRGSDRDTPPTHSCTRPTATSTTVAVASDGINADALPTTSLTDLVTTAPTTRRVGA